MFLSYFKIKIFYNINWAKDIKYCANRNSFVYLLRLKIAGSYQKFYRFFWWSYEFINVSDQTKTKKWHTYACYSAQKLHFPDQYT